MSHYAHSQTTRDREYSEAYADWVAKLSPRQRRKLADCGVEKPQRPSYRTQKPDHEAVVANLSCAGAAGETGYHGDLDLSAAAEPDAAAESDAAAVRGGEPERSSGGRGGGGLAAESEAVREAALALVRGILGEIMSQDNARLALDCYALVTGVGYMGESETAIAKKHGVSRAAVSKRCVEISNALNLPPSPAMRKLTARRAYEQRAKQHHAGAGH